MPELFDFNFSNLDLGDLDLNPSDWNWGNATFNNMFNLLPEWAGVGETLTDANSYFYNQPLGLYEPSQNYNMFGGTYGLMPDYSGGGGVGGALSKTLFYPTQETGMASVGSGIQSQGNDFQSLLAALMAGG